MNSEERLAVPTDARPYAIDDPFGQPSPVRVRNTVVNPEELDTFYPEYTADVPSAKSAELLAESTPGADYVTESPSPEGQPATYVIITNNRDENGNQIGDLVAEFEVWAHALHDFGIPTRVITVDDIIANSKYVGFDVPMRIRNFIQDAVLYWGTHYVLFGGDLSVVPARRIGGPQTGFLGIHRPDPVTDYWYTRIAIDDHLERGRRLLDRENSEGLSKYPRPGRRQSLHRPTSCPQRR